MKKSIQLVFLMLVISLLVLSACSSDLFQVPLTPTSMPTNTPGPTNTPKPTAIPFVMPKGDFEMSWDIYSSEYNTLGGILTISRKGSKYTEKLVLSDGSSGIYDLTVISEGNEIKLSGHLGDSYSLYPHDYMQIESNGWLGFYDDQGYIYGVAPLK